MTVEEINECRKKLEKEIKSHQNSIEHLRLDLKHLQSECSHKDIVHGCCMGESCSNCPDCGMSSN